MKPDESFDVLLVWMSSTNKGHTSTSLKKKTTIFQGSGIPRGGWGVQPTPPEILKALQNRAKLNPIVKIVKNCWI